MSEIPDAPDSSPPSSLLGRWARETQDYAILFLNADARVAWANAAVTRVLGYEPADLVGESLRRIFSEEDRKRGLDEHELAVAIEVGRAADDRWHVCKDGSLVYCNGILTTLRGDAGELVGFVKVFRDRTDLRTQTEALENRLSEALRVAGRNDAFLSALAHELRNPIGTISNAAGLLRRFQHEERVARTIEVVERQAATMARLVEDMLEATRIDVGRVKLKLESVVLQDAIRSAAGLHDEALRARQQALSVLVPDVPIVMEADPTRLEQILRNLLENAVKYTPPQGRIWITATVEGHDAVVRVQDDGDGMSADTLPRIFDMFTREAKALDSATDGLGIGLAVVKNLVQLHNGVVEVQSAGPGRGSEFTLILPLEQPKPG